MRKINMDIVIPKLEYVLVIMDGVDLLVARSMAHPSATLIRGNAAVHRQAGCCPLATWLCEPSLGGPLAHLVPEGDSAYELWVQ